MLAAEPDHEGAIHLYIHLLEASTDAAQVEPGLHPIVTLQCAALGHFPTQVSSQCQRLCPWSDDRRSPQAEPYAERLAALAPGASHLVHMPSHTFMHTGRYDLAAEVNRLAARSL